LPSLSGKLIFLTIHILRSNPELIAIGYFHKNLLSTPQDITAYAPFWTDIPKLPGNAWFEFTHNNCQT
jgi:hypothetical protein